MKRLIAVATAIALGAACTNSGLGGAQDTSPVTATGGGGTTPGALSCQWQGTWDMAKAFCGQIDLADPPTNYFSTYEQASLVITDSGNADGNCDVVFTWTTAGVCSETEEWEILYSDSETELNIRFGGITDCSPADCSFGPDDADACFIGGNINADAVPHQLEILQDGQIRVIGLLDYSVAPCNIGFMTEWRRQ